MPTITTRDGTGIFYKDWKIYPGAPHGLANTTAYKDTLSNDLPAFIRG